MKSLLTVFIFTVAVCQVFDSYAVVQAQRVRTLNITVFYQTLNLEHLELYNQLVLNANDPDIKDLIVYELIPFGNTTISENPFNIKCQHGPDECYGNVMNACFFARHADIVKRAEFLKCCMNDIYPPHAVERCSAKVVPDLKVLPDCAHSKEAVELQLKNGKRTLEFSPKLTSFPAIVFDNVFNAQDQQDAFMDLQAVIIRKLEGKGVKVVRKNKGA